MIGNMENKETLIKLFYNKNSCFSNPLKKYKPLIYQYLSAFILILFSLTTTAQQLPFSHLNIADGLGDTVVFSIEQDNLGFLWIATRTGINRFDGEKFWTYGKKDGLPHNLARELLNSKQGVLWAASESGLAWFDGESFQAVPDWPQNTSARAISEASDGTLWVATYGAGLLQIKTGGNPKIINSIDSRTGLPKNRVRSVFVDKDDNIWASMSDIVVKITKGKVKEIPWLTKDSEIRDFYQHRDGSIWVGTRHGVVKYDGNAFKPLDMGVDLSKQTVNTILLDNNGNLWLGTRDFGVYKFDENLNHQHFDMSDGLPDNSINSIFQDNEGNIWFGTYGGGLSRLSTSKVLNWKTEAHLTNPNVYSIADDEIGCIWIGTNGNGVSSLCDGAMTYYSRDDGLPHNKVLSTLIDNNGTPWFGTLQGLSHLVDGKFINYDQAQGMSGSINYHIIQASDHSFWIGTNNGLDHFDGDNFTQFNTNHGLPSNRINRILESKNGGLWIASANGLTRYKNDKFINFSTSDGLPANFINDFYEDDVGGLWIATNNGLSYFIAGQFENWTTQDGLPHNNATVVLPGNKDDIWIGTSRGVAIFDGKDFTVITSKEGLVFDLVNRGAGFKGKNGDFWFGTGKGISQFAADFKPGSTEPPPVHLLSVSNNNKLLSLDLHSTIQQQGSSLNFKYAAVSFQRSPDVHFRYRLAQSPSTDWRETRLRELQINSLAPGKYTFEVTARIGTGKWNPQPSTFSFTVTPPFWRTMWFLALVVVVVFGAFFYRNHRSKLHALNLENTVLERTKQLHEVNKGLEWLANHDSLTHLANRNHVHNKLDELHETGHTRQLGILIIDLDYFKAINDKHGHSAGDVVLKVFAQMLQKVTRKEQLASRWGGEEFLVICPQIDAQRLEHVAQEIIHYCQQLKIIISRDETISLNCSIGFALTPLDHDPNENLPWEKTIQLADMALYDAKHSGRNCAIGYIWKSPLSENWDFEKAIKDKSLAIEQGLLERV